MPLTVQARSVGYNPRGTRRVLFVPLSVMSDGVLDTAALTDPTTVDMTNDVVSYAGFTGQQAQEPDPDMGSLETGTVPGEITYPESSVTIRLSKTGPANDLRAVLVQGDDGYIVIANEGLTAGLSADVARVTVGYIGKQNETVARAVVPFSVASIQEDVTIPALV